MFFCILDVYIPVVIFLIYYIYIYTIIQEKQSHTTSEGCVKSDAMLFLGCSRQASIVLKRYFRFEFSLLSILCMLIARM